MINFPNDCNFSGFYLFGEWILLVFGKRKFKTIFTIKQNFANKLT